MEPIRTFISDWLRQPEVVVEIRFQEAWRPRRVQRSSADGFAVEGITGWFRNSDEGKSWR